MTTLTDWLARRRPPPPPDLARGLGAAGAGGPADTVLATAASDRLAEARARPGRIRESAFRLLEADALLTYACEAALEADDPEAALTRILATLGE